MSNDYSIPVLRARIVSDYENTLARLDAHSTLFDSVVRSIPSDSIVSVTPTLGSFDLHIAGDRHTLTAGIRALRTHGFTREGEPPQPKQPSFSGFYYHPGGAIIWFSFTSRACRRVKVGTKMVEQDIYETVCDETILPETRPEEAAA